MRKIGTVLLAMATGAVLGFTLSHAMNATQAHQSVGTALQQVSGDAYEVIYNPSTGIYTIEPR